MAVAWQGMWCWWLQWQQAMSLLGRVQNRCDSRLPIQRHLQHSPPFPQFHLTVCPSLQPPYRKAPAGECRARLPCGWCAQQKASNTTNTLPRHAFLEGNL